MARFKNSKPKIADTHGCIRGSSEFVFFFIIEDLLSKVTSGGRAPFNSANKRVNVKMVEFYQAQ